jgi:GTP pyrophosphokinase
MTVHRLECPNLGRLPPERVMPAGWGERRAEQRFPVDVELVASNAPTLMRDILDILSREKVRVAASSSFAQGLGLRMLFTLEVEDLPQLTRLLAVIRDLPGVTGARRR